MDDIKDSDIQAAIRMWDNSGTIGVLVSGPNDKRQAWALAVWPEVFDGREKTNRCFIWFNSSEAPRDRLTSAIEAAKKNDVTLQLLCVGERKEETKKDFELGGGAKASVTEMKEWYPVLHLGSDKIQWPPKRRKAQC